MVRIALISIGLSIILTGATALAATVAVYLLG
jgi:hypothetical protein